MKRKQPYNLSFRDDENMSVLARKVKLDGYPKADFIVHKDLYSNNRWAVSELRTGMRVLKGEKNEPQRSLLSRAAQKVASHVTEEGLLSLINEQKQVNDG